MQGRIALPSLRLQRSHGWGVESTAQPLSDAQEPVVHKAIGFLLFQTSSNYPLERPVSRSLSKNRHSRRSRESISATRANVK